MGFRSAATVLATTAYWLLLRLRGLAPRTSFWRDAQFDTIRLCLIKVAGRVTEMVTRIKIALPTAFPYQAGFADLASRIAKRRSRWGRMPQHKPLGATSNPDHLCRRRHRKPRPNGAVTPQARTSHE